MTVTVQDVSAALQAIVDPNTGKDLVAGKSARNIQVDGDDVAVDVELGYPGEEPGRADPPPGGGERCAALPGVGQRQRQRLPEDPAAHARSAA